MKSLIKKNRDELNEENDDFEEAEEKTNNQLVKGNGKEPMVVDKFGVEFDKPNRKLRMERFYQGL